MWQRLNQEKELKSVLIAASLFLVFGLSIALHRYLSFYANTDHGLFNQVAWNTLHGHWFESSLFSAFSANVGQLGQVADVNYHNLAHHFTISMGILIPFYGLFPHPSMLVVIQVVLMTAAGLVLYVLTRHHVKAELAAMIAISYYAANAVIGPAIGNFFNLCQLPLYVFGLLLALEKRRWLWFWPLVILTLGIREDAGVVLFSIGFYWAVSRRSPKLGLALCGLSLAYMIWVTNWIMPLFAADISQRFMIERFGHFVETSEASTLDILWAMATHPWQVIAEWFMPLGRKIQYLLGHWLPLALIPAISPAAWLSALFPMSQLFLQQGTMRFAINIRYAVAVVPGIFYGTILWWSHHQHRFQGQFRARFRKFWQVAIGLSLFFTFTSNPHEAWFFLIPDSIDPWLYKPIQVQWHHVNQLNPVLAQIPDDASVCATQYLLPRLSGRRAIFPDYQWQFRNDTGEVAAVDYIVIDFWRSFYRSAFRGERGSLRHHLDSLEGFIGDGRYGMIDFRDGAALLKYGAESQPEVMAPWLDYRQQLEEILQQDNEE
jgi:uncharacterized membrane protein